jgi:hypothetical protein
MDDATMLDAIDLPIDSEPLPGQDFDVSSRSRANSVPNELPPDGDRRIRAQRKDKGKGKERETNGDTDMRVKEEPTLLVIPPVDGPSSLVCLDTFFLL